MSDSLARNQDLCERHMPIEPGRQVTVKNPQGEVVGFGTLKPIDFDPEAGTCRSSWTAEGVPASSDVYSLLIGAEYEPIFFRQAEGEAGLTSAFPDPATP